MREGDHSIFNRVRVRPGVRINHRLSSVLVQSSGSTAAEYAIMLALVVTGVLIAGQTLSRMARNSFDQIALQSHSPKVEVQQLSPTEFLVEEVEAESTWVGAYPVLLERTAMLLLLCACLYFIRRHRKVVHADLAAKEQAKVHSYEQLQVFLKRQQIYHVLSSNIDSLFNSQVQVQHLMSKRVTTVKPHMQVARMRQLMTEKQVRHLLVCDDSQHLLGIISDRDLHCNDTITAEQVMTRELITVPPDALVSTVISLMLKEQISSVPIVQEGRIQGLMTTTDLIMAMQCALQLWRQMTDEHGTPTHELHPEPKETEPAVQEELELMPV